MGESEIAKLCQKIYQKHQRALDMIFEYKPDLQIQIRQHLEGLIDQNENLLKDHCIKSYIRFLPKEWDVPILNKGDRLRAFSRMLLFIFDNGPKGLALRLYIRNGDPDIREKLFNMARANTSIFKASSSLDPKKKTIYKQKFLTQKDLEEEEFEVLIEKIKKQWDKFLAQDFPSILDVVQGQEWIWGKK